MPKKDRLFGSDVMGYKLKENNGDKSCPYYTMKEVNFLDYVRKNQEQRSREKLIGHNFVNLGNETIENFDSKSQKLDGVDAMWVNPNDLDLETLKQRFKFKKS